jgi:hypothetical protein
MENHQGLLFRVLMLRAHGSISPAMLQPLPKKDASILLENHVTSQNPLPIFNNEIDILSKLHFSWLFKMLPDEKKRKKLLLLSYLSEGQRKGLAQISNLPLPPPIKSPLLNQFYISKLLSGFKFPKLLPIPYLPESPFNRLLKLTKGQLVDIIDLLGIYDLAHEMRRIVATKNLKNIYKCLSPKHQQFLRQCLHAKDKVITPKLHLDQWNGEEKPLKTVLHRRGLMRLAIALSGQHTDLIWQIAHILDTGRGQNLLDQVKKEEIPSISSAVAIQIDTAYNFAFQGQPA